MAAALHGPSAGDPNGNRPSRPLASDRTTSEDMLQPKLAERSRGDDNAAAAQLLSPSPSPSPLPSPSLTPLSTESTMDIATTIEAKPASDSEAAKSEVRRRKIAELAESLPIAPIAEITDMDVTMRERGRGRSKDTLRQPGDGMMGSGSGFSPLLGARKDDTVNQPQPPPAASLDSAPRVERYWGARGSMRTPSASTPPAIGGRRRVPAPSQPTVSSASSGAAPRLPPLHTEGGAGPTGPTAAPLPPPLRLSQSQKEPVPVSVDRLPSPIAPASIPLPPMSLPTLLQLELAGQRPSPLYIHQSHALDLPYESNAVKFERLKNFLLLPTYLERTIYFGALACLDAWLWTLTILPIRFLIALGVLVRWWGYMAWKEVRFMTAYVWQGMGRMWKRGRRPSVATAAPGPQPPPPTTTTTASGRSRGRSNGSSTSGSVPPPVVATGSMATPAPAASRRQASPVPAAAAPYHRQWHRGRTSWGHRRAKSMPSNLTSVHKADLLQGAVIMCSALALMNLDASRMYHFIRAQSAVKLYVIYNLVEVGDRLLAALGQDVFECLFSAETLSRTASGRSKLLLPFGMFCLGLVYNVAHTIVLFYQVITLNVAVNSYSNALLSLLMSNQFVEVKSSVFKRTEKENTFQLACADIVERFQLWIVLFIIAMRNIVEIGGLSVPGSIETGEDLLYKVPLHNTSILPASFTILPPWLTSVEVLSPFLIVIGSEMIVDWIKHGYINKFNNIKPQFYSRVLDILCKDYYTNAFMAPALMRRLGLPLIPLCTLFLRSSIQTYHMFLATHLPSPSLPSSSPQAPHTSLATAMGGGGGPSAATPSSPAMAASLDRLDQLIRNALGRSVHGNPYSSSSSGGETVLVSTTSWWKWSSDDVIACVTMVVVFFIVFLILLVVRMLLSMALLRYARNRYASMKAREYDEAQGKVEPESYEATGKRTGGYGKIEVGEERRRWIFHDDPEGLKKQREKERKGGKKEVDLGKITRYEMVAKRIW